MKEEKRRRKRGFQATATLDHDAGALQVDSWRGFRGKRPRGSPKRWRGRQERISMAMTLTHFTCQALYKALRNGVTNRNRELGFRNTFEK